MGKHLAIGIDLGTSTSEICVFRNNEPIVIPDPSAPGHSPIVPSIVAVNKRGELAVGQDALQYINLPGAGVREVKRKMGTDRVVKLGGMTHRPEEISALILKKLKQNAEQMLGVPIRDVVVSVPANFPDAARQATMNAGELAGLNIVRLINEPTAAALAFGVKNIDTEEQVVVFDFGGGTLDITVLEMMAGVIDVKCSFGDTELGGKDFDETLMKLIFSRFVAENPGVKVFERVRNQLKEAAEKAKIALSTQQEATVFLANFGILSQQPVDLDVQVTREDFETAVAPLLERARACVNQAMNAKKLRPSSMHRVLLVGGTTYIPCVRKLVAEMFGKTPSADVNPDLAVAMGASVQAALVAGEISPERGIVLTDVAPFGLGIDVVAYVGGRQVLVYEPLILPNTTIPYTTQKVYRLLHANQDEVTVRLYQDHSGTARLPSEAVDTGIGATIPDIPPASDGIPHPLEVRFSYDINGIATLSAQIPGTGQRMQVVFENSPARMGENEMQSSLRRVNELWKADPNTKRYEAIIEKAIKLEEVVPDAAKQRLRASVASLRNAMETGDAVRAVREADALTDLLFELESDMN